MEESTENSKNVEDPINETWISKIDGGIVTVLSENANEVIWNRNGMTFSTKTDTFKKYYSPVSI